MTPDGLPVVGPAGDIEGLEVIGGLSSIGMITAPASRGGSSGDPAASPRSGSRDPSLPSRGRRRGRALLRRGRPHGGHRAAASATGGEPAERAHAASGWPRMEGEVVGWAGALRWATSAEGSARSGGSSRRRGGGEGSARRSTRPGVGTSSRLVPASSSRGRPGRRAAASCSPAASSAPGRGACSAPRPGVGGLSRSRLRAEKEAEGYALVPLAAVADRPEELYALDAAAIADVPGTYAEDDVRLEDWLEEALAHPQLSREGARSSSARASRSPTRSSTSTRPRTLAANEMTGTRDRDHRRGARPPRQARRRSPGRGSRATS